MNKKFTPIDYLSPSEVQIWKRVSVAIKHTKNKKKLEFYETLFDTLLERAIKNYRIQNGIKTRKKELIEKI